MAQLHAAMQQFVGYATVPPTSMAAEASVCEVRSPTNGLYSLLALKRRADLVNPLRGLASILLICGFGLLGIAPNAGAFTQLSSQAREEIDAKSKSDL
jgi:hypothetical protein